MYQYCILPSGNQPEFLGIDCDLIRRNVDAYIAYLYAGGRLYQIPESDLHKLPTDDRGPYLGTSDSGHSIYKIDYIDYIRVQWGASEWVSLLQISQEAKNAVKATRDY